MEPERVYIIKISQLKELCSSKNQDRKYELYADILGEGPHKERSTGSVLSGGLVKGAEGLAKGVGKGFTAAVDVVDFFSKPPKKGSGRS